MNLTRAQQILQRLFDEGVREFCVCAGSRNAPLVMVLSAAKNVEVLHFFDERSAAFFALGRCQQFHRPVAVVTTSGTAAAELLPATIEAHYSHLPLILVTADRPPSYRRTGSPQSIEQVGIFSHYVERSWDLHPDAEFRGRFSIGSRPVHINVCFDEPLLDGEVLPFEFATDSVSEPASVLFAKREGRPYLESQRSAPSSWQALEEFTSSVSRPLVIVGQLPTELHKPAIDLLKSLKAPIYAESLSGLRECKELEPWLLRSGEKILKSSCFAQCDGVLRIGGVPTVRFWRDLEGSHSHLRVLSLTPARWPGLSRGEVVSGDEVAGALDFLRQHASPFPLALRDSIMEKDRDQFLRLSQLFEQEPISEPSLIRRLSQMIPQHSRVYLGNSLPVREWDLSAQFEGSKLLVGASRGANGIDGQISTFFGGCTPERENWAIVGDLTALYDLSSPWILPHLEKCTIRIVIINNQGGQIFARLFNNPQFINAHKLDFRSWSAMWNLGYQRWNLIPMAPRFMQHQVIELFPDQAGSDAFWKKYEMSWKDV